MMRKVFTCKKPDPIHAEISLNFAANPQLYIKTYIITYKFSDRAGRLRAHTKANPPTDLLSIKEVKLE